MKKSFHLLRRSEEFVRDLRLAAAIHRYQKRVKFQEKAATVRFEPPDFIEALYQEQVDVPAVDFGRPATELERG